MSPYLGDIVSPFNLVLDTIITNIRSVEILFDVSKKSIHATNYITDKRSQTVHVATTDVSSS